MKFVLSCLFCYRIIHSCSYKISKYKPTSDNSKASQSANCGWVGDRSWVRTKGHRKIQLRPRVPVIPRYNFLSGGEWPSLKAAGHSIQMEQGSNIAPWVKGYWKRSSQRRQILKLYFPNYKLFSISYVREGAWIIKLGRLQFPNPKARQKCSSKSTEKSISFQDEQLKVLWLNRMKRHFREKYEFFLSQQFHERKVKI